MFGRLKFFICRTNVSEEFVNELGIDVPSFTDWDVGVRWGEVGQFVLNFRHRSSKATKDFTKEIGWD